MIGLSKFAQTFAVRFLKLFFIHSICINACGSFSFKASSQYNGKNLTFTRIRWSSLGHCFKIVVLQRGGGGIYSNFRSCLLAQCGENFRRRYTNYKKKNIKFFLVFSKWPVMDLGLCFILILNWTWVVLIFRYSITLIRRCHVGKCWQAFGLSWLFERSTCNRPVRCVRRWCKECPLTKLAYCIIASIFFMFSSEVLAEKWKCLNPTSADITCSRIRSA